MFNSMYYLLFLRNICDVKPQQKFGVSKIFKCTLIKQGFIKVIKSSH